MKQQPKLSQEQQHEEAHQTKSPAGQEFATAEELLRHDAAQTAVPPHLAERLKHSTQNAVPPRTSWIKRLFN